MKIQHITMFKYVSASKTVQCVISVESKADFEKLGFVDSVDKVKKPTRKKAVKDDN